MDADRARRGAAGGRARRARSSAAPSIDLQATIYVVARRRCRRVARALRDRPELAVRLARRADRRRLLAARAALRARLHCSCRSSIGAALRVKVRLDGDEARVATVSGIWPAANWLEREVWDLFGIVFDGHPDPRRLLMPEDWEGYPAAQGLSGADRDDAADDRADAGDRGGVPRERREGSAVARLT